MTSPAGVDYFALLGLDPDAVWDQARFELVLKKKQAEWSRNKVMGVGKKKAEAEVAYGLIPAIRADLSDPAQREVYASVARQARNSQGQEKRAELEERIRLCAARGYLLEAEATAFLREYSSLGDAAVKALLAPIPIRAAAPKAQEPEPIDPVTATEISQKLARVGAQSLYEFLMGSATGPSRNLDTETLLAKARGIYGEANSAATKGGHLDDRIYLAGQGLTLFSSKELRARYDATLRRQQFDVILKKATFAASVTRGLTVKEVQMLIEEASLAGLSPGDTRNALIDHAAREKFAIEVPNLDDQPICGCGGLNPQGAGHCRVCGQPLIFPCPRCAIATPSAVAACGSCGFPVGRRFYVAALLEELRGLVAAQDVLVARERLAEARSSWPSPGGDTLSLEIAALSSKVTEAASAFDAAVVEAHRLFDARACYSAQARLHSLPKIGDPGLVRLRAQVEETIAESERLLAVLPGGGPPEYVAKECLRILELCSDSEVARSHLAKHPPLAPRHLQASVRAHSIGLTWLPSASPDVHYVVVRRKGARPQHADDGERVARLRDVQFDDASAEAGAEINYGVFAEWGGVTSTTAAYLDAPALRVADVTNVRARAGDGQVQVDWDPPPNVRHVFAMRTPARSKVPPLQGHRLESLDTRHILDRSATNEQEYRYTIYCEFTRATGQASVSPGTHVVVTPRESPAELTDFRIVSSGEGPGREVRLSWAQPSKGDVWILISPEPPKCVGEAIPVRGLKSLGEVRTAPGVGLTVPWQEGGVLHYTPVVVVGETAYVGAARRYVHLADAQQLEAQNLGDRIRLTWSWPETCTLAYINFSGSGWPVDAQGQFQPRATRLTVTRNEYDLHGWHDLRPSSGGDVYIVVQATVKAGTETLVAPGARRQVHLRSRVNVEYELGTAGLFRKSVELKISTDHPTDLPPFRVVRRQGLVPKDRDDGECVLRQSGGLHVGKPVRLTLSGGTLDGRGFGKLFLENDQDYEWIAVFHPDRTKLRI